MWVCFSALLKAYKAKNTGSPNVTPGVFMAPMLLHKNLHHLFVDVNQIFHKTFPTDLLRRLLQRAGKKYLTETTQM